jgi:hypothetical protein
MSSVAFAIASAVTFFASQPAAPVQYGGSVSGIKVTICLDGQNVEETFAGKLGFRDGSSQWTSVCADVRTPISQGQIFGVRLLHSSKLGGRVQLAGNIVAKFFKAAQTPEQCAGLQLAVWKALEDGTPDPDFTDGHFEARAPISVLKYASYYYQAINTPGDAIYLMSAAQGQSSGGGQESGAGQSFGGGQGQGQGPGGQSQFSS